MKSQTVFKENKTKRNIKRAAKIMYLMKINGITQKMIAQELHITIQAVSNSINGFSKISRVDNWLKENLEIGTNQNE